MYLVITKKDCSYCAKAMAYLDQTDQDYITVDITDDADAKRALRRVGFRTVPVVVPIKDTLDYEGLTSARTD